MNKSLTINHLKDIEIKYYFIREKAQKRDIDISYMPWEKLMIDDITRALPIESFERHMMLMRLRYISCIWHLCKVGDRRKSCGLRAVGPTSNQVDGNFQKRIRDPL